MLVLRSSPTSPFGRKVKIAAAVLGLSDRIEVAMADTMDPVEPLRQQNPLGKIPVLILEDGRALYDSRVIVDYLDDLAGGGRIIPRGRERFDVLVLQALADGLLDAGILKVYEARFRDASPQQRWLDHQSGKVERTFAALEERELPTPTATPHIGAIALACAAGYFDLRFPDWRDRSPRLAAWTDEFARLVPSFDATRPPG